MPSASISTLLSSNVRIDHPMTTRSLNDCAARSMAGGAVPPQELGIEHRRRRIVGVVALPLAMAFAIASGAKPEQGLYTAIVAGLLVSACGGSRVQIAGPTGAFIVILSGITAKHGIDGLQIATLMAGLILLAWG